VVFDELLKPVTEYFRGKSYWPVIQPVFALISVYIAACVLAYEYLQSHVALIGGKLPLFSLFIHSYVFKQISLVAGTVAVVGLAFRITDRRHDWLTAVRPYRGLVVRRTIVVLVVLCIAVPVFRSFTPRDVSNIRVLFLQDPNDEFDQSAFVYLLYELNARQRRWHFDVDFDVYNKNAHANDIEGCTGEPLWICLAEKEAAGRPLIAIAVESLGSDHFWQNRGQVSVVTTADWKPIMPPSMYEYLTYLAILQSMLIHVNTECSGVPVSAFDERRVGFGDLFEFTPRRYAMKPAVLAAHISPVQEIMLMNCFGADYVNSVSSLITLDWLRSDPVKKNLALNFGVILEAQDKSK
jgi:hypothetical protein